MLAKLNTFALLGIDAVPVEVEVDVSPGLPKTILVGLPEASVRESIHRIERALVNLGYGRMNAQCPHPGPKLLLGHVPSSGQEVWIGAWPETPLEDTTTRLPVT